MGRDGTGRGTGGDPQELDFDLSLTGFDPSEIDGLLALEDEEKANAAPPLAGKHRCPGLAISGCWARTGCCAATPPAMPCRGVRARLKFPLATNCANKRLEEGIDPIHQFFSNREGRVRCREE